MTRIDLRTEAWLSDIGLYCGGNTYDPEKLRQVTADKSEWSERLKRNFEHVLNTRQLNAQDYEAKVDIEFASDEELYAYLQRLFVYLFTDGPFPSWDQDGVVADLRTQAWLDDMFIYGGGNVYGPAQLKGEIDACTEWAERLRSNFDHVLAKRELTSSEYEDRTEISFDTDVEFYDYLAKLHRFLFSDGAMP